MKPQILLVLGILAVLAVSGCSQTGQVVNKDETPQKICPSSCDDGNTCTRDICSSETNYMCFYKPIVPCCGNNKCETGECKSCPSDCSQADCPVFTVDTYHDFGPNDRIEYVSRNITFYPATDGANNNLVFHIEAGDEKVENLTISADCGGVLIQNENGGYTEYVKSIRTGKIQPPFHWTVAYNEDMYGRPLEEVHIFSTDYFINNEGVLLDENRAVALLMNPQGSVNYRIWFNPYDIVPVTDNVAEPGKYVMQCEFDFVSQEPYYVMNRDINIYFVV